MFDMRVMLMIVGEVWTMKMSQMKNECKLDKAYLCLSEFLCSKIWASCASLNDSSKFSLFLISQMFDETMPGA